MYDQRGIIDHIQELEQSLSDWKRYQQIPLEDFLKIRDKQNMVLHALLIATQSAIDIANHLIAERNLTHPTTYRECFEILTAANLLPSDLASKLADLAGFRNVLGHIYWRLDCKPQFSRNWLKIQS
ncbi:MAG: type VII toxin-antitoxin system HepT family RNase toxin [Candidatus Helarchaeota archaeon]